MSGALRLELRPSRLLAAAIVAAHAAAAVAVYVAMPSGLAALLAAMLLALGVAAAWSRALLRGSGSVRTIELGVGQPVVELASGERLAVEVAPRRYVTRHLVALPMTVPYRRTLLVTGDMLGRDEFRRLRIWALWNRLPSKGRSVAAKQLPA